LWFAANSSVISLGLGAVLLGTGMSLRQSIVATLAGVAISFLPLGLGTLAGKWSGQPTMVVSRATFGHSGNILPAVLAVITRIFWGGVLLWLLATAVAQVLVGAGLDAGLGTTVWQFVGLVSGFVIATVVAMFGYGFVAKLQLVLSTVNGLLILGAAALTFQHLNFAAALTAPDGSWVLAIGGASIVFSVIGLAWVHSSSDIARYQRPGSSGGASMLWATFGATLPPFLLICWGAMLAASDPALAAGLQTNPLAAIASLLPLWYPAPLLAAASLGLLSGAVLTIYSGGFALQALGVRMRRDMSTLVSALLVLAAAGALLFLVSDFSTVVRSLIITIAVPVAAWAGIFAAEMMIRTRRFHTPSLLAAGGIYPQVRWLNLIALVVVSAIGYGFVTSNVIGLQWQGFFFTAIGVAPGDPVGSSNAGVFVALVLGLLVPLAGGISTIRRQETSVPGAAHSSHAAPVITAAPAPTTGSVAVATPDQTHSTIPAD
jgi:purine-cytosine permease-like protein